MNPRNTAIELRYADSRRRIRNRLRKYDGRAMTRLLMDRLRHAEQDSDHIERHLPWNLLLLLKWTFLFAHFGPLTLTAPTTNDVNRLMNELNSIDGELRLPSEHQAVHLFFRGISHQQFWCQSDPSRPRIARQSLLFRKLPETHRLRRRFRQLHGIDIPQWLDLSYMLLTGFLTKNTGSIDERYFSSVYHEYHPTLIRAFLATLSRTPEETRAYLHEMERAVPRDSSEFRELTPLVRHPLLRIDTTYICYYTPLLLRGIETSIYDFFRADDPSAFMNTFGDIFERYVHRTLEYLGQPFLVEPEIVKKYGLGKATDFAVPEDEAVVLIDAKAAELSHHGMTTHRPEVLSAEVKTSALKGIRQAVALLHRMRASETILSENVFVIVVTYKQFYLGTGADFLASIPADRYAGDGISADQMAEIPPEHIYFVSIDEFEDLVASLKENHIGLVAFLRSVKAKNSTFEGKRMLIQQHLEDLPIRPQIPQFILDEFEGLHLAAAIALEKSGA